MKLSFTKLFDVPFTFEKRPKPLPGEMRPHWKIATLLVLLDVSRGKKASLRKLHVLNWMIRNSQSRERFVKYVNGELPRTNIVVRIDPGLNHAIDLVRAEGLVELISGKTVALTEKGKVLVREIAEEGDMFVEEMEFALMIKPHIHENKIDELLDWREIP
jgi:hypothetical protein